MNNQEILDNAPEGATHVMGGNCYCMENTEDDYSEDGYDYLTFRNEDTSGRHRSLADIKRIAELEKEQAKRDLEQQAKGVSQVQILLRGNDWEDDELQLTLASRSIELNIKAKALKEKGE